METADQEFDEQLNYSRLNKAYLRVAAEAQKIKESPGVTAIKGEAPKPQRKPRKPKEQPAEQLRMF